MNHVDEAAERTTIEQQTRAEIQRNHLAPLGQTDLPAFLDKRRVEYQLPNELFVHQACGNRVLFYPMGIEGDKKFEGTSIIMPDFADTRDKKMTPKGLLVSAGIEAMDYMVDQGIELGDIIWHDAPSPTRVHCCWILRRQFVLYEVPIESIVADMDLRHRIMHGWVEFVREQRYDRNGNTYLAHVAKRTDKYGLEQNDE